MYNIITLSFVCCRLVLLDTQLEHVIMLLGSDFSHGRTNSDFSTPLSIVAVLNSHAKMHESRQGKNQFGCMSWSKRSSRKQQE